MNQLVITAIVFVALTAVFVTVSIINKKNGRKNRALRAVFIVLEVPVIISSLFSEKRILLRCHNKTILTSSTEYVIIYTVPAYPVIHIF